MPRLTYLLLVKICIITSPEWPLPLSMLHMHAFGDIAPLRVNMLWHYKCPLAWLSRR